MVVLKSLSSFAVAVVLLWALSACQEPENLEKSAEISSDQVSHSDETSAARENQILTETNSEEMVLQNTSEPVESTKEKVLFDPDHPQMQVKAPETYQVLVETSQGYFVIEAHRKWAPHGADRFYNLVRHGFYDGARFFRVIKSPKPFMAQFGLPADPQLAAIWSKKRIPDDPVRVSNLRGYVSYAKTNEPHSRSTQIFINYGDNRFLDRQGFTPFAKVIEGMKIVDKFYAQYGEGAPQGRGPNQMLIQRFGNQYLNDHFPKLDWIKRAVIVE